MNRPAPARPQENASPALREPTARIWAQFESLEGRTRLTRLEARAPLKIARTFPRPDGGVAVCVMDASPGLLAGDYYQMEWHVEAGARVEATTQGFTRVHPSRERPCRLETRIFVESNAVLEWFPEPVMPFRDAALHGESVAHLGAGAVLLAGEIWCAGRIERGERFAFASFSNRWRVERAGVPLFASSLDLQPERFAPSAPGALGEWTHAGNFWAFGVGGDDALLDALWEVLESEAPPCRAVYGGATLLPSGGAMVSLLGRRAHDLQEVVSRLRLRAREYVGKNCSATEAESRPDARN